MPGFYDLAYEKIFPPALTSSASFAGKTVLLTGGTSGLGLEAAKKFVWLGAWTVIITARDAAKGERAKEEIEFVCHERAEDFLDIQVWPLDMSDWKSIKNFAQRVKRELPRLDIVVLNAGQRNREWSIVSDTVQWETTLMVNTLGTIFLALLLLPKLLETAKTIGADQNDPPHLNFIGSSEILRVSPETYSSYQDCQNVLEAVSSRDAYAGEWGQHALTKLFLEYGMRRISNLPCVAKESGEKAVIVNSTCPGVCKTDLGRPMSGQPFHVRLVTWVYTSLFAKSADVGSRSYITGVTRGVDGHGKMWKADKYFDIGTLLGKEQEETLGTEVWKEMLAIFEKETPDIMDIVGPVTYN